MKEAFALTWWLMVLVGLFLPIHVAYSVDEITRENAIAIATADFKRNVGPGRVDVEANKHTNYDLKSSIIGIRDGDQADYDRLNRLAETLRNRTIWRVQVYRARSRQDGPPERLWFTTYYVDAKTGEILR